MKGEGNWAAEEVEHELSWPYGCWDRAVLASRIVS
jgi:hypothetical protein